MGLEEDSTAEQFGENASHGPDVDRCRVSIRNIHKL
jgi:hypothetical protein